MAETKKYLDYEGLKTYHEKAKSEYDGKYAFKGETSDVDLSNYPTNDGVDKKISDAMASVDIASISNADIDLLFAFKPYPANGLYPSPDNYLRVWAGEELIAEIDSPSEIKNLQFDNKNITRGEIPNSVTSIGDNAFSGNQLTSLTIPNSVTNIGSIAFDNNQFTSLTIPDSIASISAGAFGRNSLTSLTIPSSVTSIDAGAFYGNQLTSVTIPNSVTRISSNAFINNPLETVYISRDTNFEKNAFPDTAKIIYRD